MLAVGWSEVLEQFNLVTETFENGERDFSTGDAGDFTGELPGLMCPMRKLESENILPERERTFEVRDRDAGVIGGNDAKRRSAHVLRLSDRRDDFEFNRDRRG